MNVLVYSGPGATTESVKHCLESLRLHLSPYYAVVPISENAILNDPWMLKSSLLVLPGGADLPYCKVLDGEGNRKISQFVRKGGKFLGLCAGGYYASTRCEFEVGDPEMEVSGPRELEFFPGTAKGCAFKGFVYESHAGARVANLDVNTQILPDAPEKVVNYYNGGGVFLNADSYKGVEVVARYSDKLDIEDEGKAAVIYKKVGKGDVILTGSHPEFTPTLLNAADGDENYGEVIKAIKEGDKNRRLFFKSCLVKLGLKVNENVDVTVPKITPLYLSSHLNKDNLNELVKKLKSNTHFHGNTLEDDNDTFVFHDEAEDDHDYFIAEDHGTIEGADEVPKHVKVFSEGNLPDPKSTPYFNMSAYYSHLEKLYDGRVGEFGSILGYGEVVTSTNTLMDRNPSFLQSLPNGFTITATTQVAGRGRGGNVWINPKGVMASSVLFKIPSGEKYSSSVVTLQYLCGLALIESILGYGSFEAGKGIGYEDLPVRLKWPNDIYILKPEFFHKIGDKDEISSTVEGDEAKYAKVSGALINSQFLNGSFYLVWGGGVNVSNEAPTTSLNVVLAQLNVIREKKGLPALPRYQHELLLAKLLHTMDQFYSVFKTSGLQPFLPLYYKRWFHTNQLVRLQSDATSRERKCKVKGITSDYGLLIAEDVDTHEVLQLQPDGNSFDIFKGLIYKKS
ncbi:biotin holocarboxylase synthetase [Scheffersomyces xylosifermentans]|uniref:biotin holocarboxylase synthetase n=1 Tax=Scheffersomyces xylosifermentans TaxID=1304137 RepID=UPI00315D8F87